ncbi:MAG: hypothetical protein J3Q66DRAFT_436094 [Benniella sp.]|nr:MAG: hypothetical protein J3Q66DRAFT_436094 [Benniella sp.]
MPALSDKVFLPISLCKLNVVLDIFKFLLINAVGACFAIYAKHGGEYAKSVGWTWSEGCRAMIKTLFNVRRHKDIPGSVKRALVLGFIATCVANILDKIVSSQITPAFRPGQTMSDVKVTSQFVPASEWEKLLGWNFHVPADGDVVEVMQMGLNSSIAIPDQVDGHIYTPVTSDYNSVPCTDFGIMLGSETVIRNDTGCGVVEVRFAYIGGKGEATWTKLGPDHWSSVMGPLGSTEVSYEIQSVPLDVSFRRGSLGNETEPEFSCSLVENHQARGVTDTYNGIAGFPRTSTTKCPRNTGHITTMAMTTTRLVLCGSAYNPEFVDTFFANKSDKLLLSMKNTITADRVSPSLQSPKAQLWIELQVHNSTIDIYVCAKSQLVYECVYGVINILHIRQTPNKSILEKLGATDMSSIDDNVHMTTYMSLEYAPKVKNGTPDPISTEKLRNDTLAATDYMARLGYNYYVDFTERKLYVQYDVAKLESGVEAPLWVLVFAGILAVVSFSVWQLTHWLVGAPHTSSLYSILWTHIASRSNTPVPRLMRSRYQPPLMLQDFNLLPDNIEHFSNGEKALPDDIVTILVQTSA